jgi:hypothetical protein
MSEKIDWINRLAKWRTVFAGWQLGTRAKTDPECQAVRDHRESTMIQRAELSAISSLLIEKGVITEDEFLERLNLAAKDLEGLYQKRFPGAKADDTGLQIDVAVFRETTKSWKP